MPGLPYGTSESVEALYLHLVSRSLTLTRKTGESLVVPELVVQLTLSSKLGGARLLLGNTGSGFMRRVFTSVPWAMRYTSRAPTTFHRAGQYRPSIACALQSFCKLILNYFVNLK